MPKFYPIMMDMEGQPALVVGGGPIAARKAETLAGYGATVTMVAIEASKEARDLATAGKIRLQERAFELSDLDEPWIVFAATNNRDLHEAIKAECDARRVICNVVDVTDLCRFIVPSIIRRGELMVTISTDGTCPAYSKYQRKRMERCCFYEGAESMLHVVAAARRELKGPLGAGMNDEEKFELLRQIAEEDAPQVLEEQGEAAAERFAVARIRELAHKHRARTPGNEDSDR